MYIFYFFINEIFIPLTHYFQVFLIGLLLTTSCFQKNSLFLNDPKVFGCTCFVRDVRPQVSKLDPKSLKYIFMGSSHVQKRYKCYCPTLRRYFVSTDVAFFETTLFFVPSTVTIPGEDDDLLVYYVSLPIPTPTLILVKPPITQVYS